MNEVDPFETNAEKKDVQKQLYNNNNITMASFH